MTEKMTAIATTSAIRRRRVPSTVILTRGAGGRHTGARRGAGAAARRGTSRCIPAPARARARASVAARGSAGATRGARGARATAAGRTGGRRAVTRGSGGGEPRRPGGRFRTSGAIGETRLHARVAVEGAGAGARGRCARLRDRDRQRRAGGGDEPELGREGDDPFGGLGPSVRVPGLLVLALRALHLGLQPGEADLA